MAKPFIKYRSGYKYQLESDYFIEIDIIPERPVVTEFIKLDMKGNLTIAQAYAWDGASRVPDTKHNMRASLIHDALYQLMRLGHLTTKEHKEKADRIFKKKCIEDGTSLIIALIFYYGLKWFGKTATYTTSKRTVHRSPK